MGAGNGKTRRMKTAHEILRLKRIESEKLFVPPKKGETNLFLERDRYQASIINFYNNNSISAIPLIEKGWHEIPPEYLTQTFSVLNQIDANHLRLILDSYCKRWNFRDQNVFYNTLADDIDNSEEFFGHLEEFVHARLQELPANNDRPVKTSSLENTDKLVF